MTATLTSVLRVFNEDEPQKPLWVTSESDAITAELAQIGVRFERWIADAQLAPGAEAADVMDAYCSSIDRLKLECGYQSVDVIRIERETPDTAPLRQKFLNEHRHSEDEVRFFVEGRGAFYLHVGARVYQTICVKGDLISVPAGTTHWFDMGSNPEFTAIRLFVNPDGWVADFTGSEIARAFPLLD